MDFKTFSRLVMIEQSVFALPFAWSGVLFAGGGNALQWISVTVIVFAARTAGMSFNRAIDAGIDAKNERTRKRPVPGGEVKPGTVWALALVSALIMIGASFFLNRLVFFLSFAAVALLFSYSYFKRFSSSSHFYLGLIEAAAPVGGYLAVNPHWAFAPLFLGAGIMFWIAGLDIIYALQDMKFDKKEGLFSLPARYGKKRALFISRMAYAASFAALASAGIGGRFVHAYWVGLIAVGIIFIKQQLAAGKKNSSRQIIYIFAINRYISCLIFLGILVEYLLHKSN